MIERIQKAETAIKAGDTKTGFEILRQVLAENPDSERAWWVMSGLVPKEQRAHCLQQVLRINPDNHFAKEALEKLPPTPVPEEDKPERKVPTGTVVETPTGKYQTWQYSQRSRVYLTLLADEGVIQAIADPQVLPRLQAAISAGKLPDALVKEKTAIAFRHITRIRQIASSLRIYYQRSGKEDSLRLELEDETAADDVLANIQERLGPNFTIQSAPMKTGSTLAVSTILTLGAAGITAFFYWGAREVASGSATATGSARTRSIIRIVELLGPTGILIIGGILILLALVISARLLLKPPLVTELIRK